MYAPFLWAFHAAETLEPMALVLKKKTLPYPPEASTTACAAWRSNSPVIRLRAMMPRHFPSTMTTSIISWRVNISTLPFEICRLSAE